MRLTLAAALFMAYVLGSLLAASATGDLSGQPLPRLTKIVSYSEVSSVP